MADRFGIVTGIEYVVLGAIIFQFIIADMLPGFEDVDSVLDQLRPVLVLGTGSLGLMWGLRLTASQMRNLKAAIFPSLVISTVTFGAIAVLPGFGLLLLYGPGPVRDLAPLFLTAAAIGMVASDKPIRSLVSFLDAQGRAPRVASRVSRVCSTLAIVTFGLVFCFYNPSDLLGGGGIEWLYWLGVHLVVGGALGAIFGAFLRREFSDEKTLTVLIGMVVFSSGFASRLHLSPLFVNFVLGLVLANSCRRAADVSERLESIEHPIYIVLAIFAGAQLEFSAPGWLYAMAAPYLLLRLAGRWIGGLLAPMGTSGAGATLPQVGRMLLAPGALSVAMALDFLMLSGDSVQLVDFPSAVPGFYGGLIAAIVVSEILAHVTTRNWLIDAADVSPRPTDSHDRRPAGGEEN
ncbi:MAG: hypothetical protein ABEL76_09430 [Bradymonadaceae bacterium]